MTGWAPFLRVDHLTRRTAGLVLDLPLDSPTPPCPLRGTEGSSQASPWSCHCGSVASCPHSWTGTFTGPCLQGQGGLKCPAGWGRTGPKLCFPHSMSGLLATTHLAAQEALLLVRMGPANHLRVLAQLWTPDPQPRALLLSAPTAFHNFSQ